MVKIASDNNSNMNNVFMKRAIELAKKGKGLTSPNPCVGAVIVKGGEIVAEGYHHKAGDFHAEIKAMKSLMKKTGLITVDLDPALFENATMYVTLEPCAHNGKTPPCVKAIVAAGFKKVVIGMKDPFEKVNGKGILYLRNNGIEVEVIKAGTKLAREIRDLNQPFIKWAKFGIPYVTMKAGISLDGKITTSNKVSKWITEENARTDAKYERSLCDAVLVGAGTVIADDPELSTNGKYKNKSIMRVIIDPYLELPLNKRVFRDENIVVITTKKAKISNIEKYKKIGIKIKQYSGEKVSIKSILKYLAGKGIQSVFLEGGSSVNGSFFDEFIKDDSAVDKILFYQAPKILGGKGALSVIGGEGVKSLNKIKEFKEISYEAFGNDQKITGIFNYY